MPNNIRIGMSFEIRILKSPRNNGETEIKLLNPNNDFTNPHEIVYMGPMYTKLWNFLEGRAPYWIKVDDDHYAMMENETPVECSQHRSLDIVRIVRCVNVYRRTEYMYHRRFGDCTTAFRRYLHHHENSSSGSSNRHNINVNTRDTMSFESIPAPNSSSSNCFLTINGRGYERLSYHSYNYPSVPDDNTPRFGLEIEVDRSNSSRTNITGNFQDKFLDLIHVEKDGSLSSGGMEIITNPMTEAEYLLFRNDFKELLSKLDQVGFSAHDGGRCGLHIHVSIKDRSNSDEEYFKHVDYFKYYEEELRSIARRDRGYHEKPLITSRENSSENISRKSNRYCPVSHPSRTYGGKTIEHRYFRGTLCFGTFDNIVKRVIESTNYAWGKVEIDDVTNNSYTIAGSYNEVLSDTIKDGLNIRAGRNNWGKKTRAYKIYELLNNDMLNKIREALNTEGGI